MSRWRAASARRAPRPAARQQRCRRVRDEGRLRLKPAGATAAMRHSTRVLAAAGSSPATSGQSSRAQFPRGARSATERARRPARHRRTPRQHRVAACCGERRDAVDEVVAEVGAGALDEQQQLLLSGLLREPAHRGDAARAHARDACHRLLDVLRRVVAAAHDHQVLAAANEEQLPARVEEPEVAGVEPAVAQHRRGRRRVAEVAAHQRRSAHPDGADAAGRQVAAVVVARRHREAGSGRPTPAISRPSSSATSRPASSARRSKRPMVNGSSTRRRSPRAPPRRARRPG